MILNLFVFFFFRLFRSKPIILILNKQDLLANKIKNGFRIEDYFREHDKDFKLLEESSKENFN